MDVILFWCQIQVAWQPIFIIQVFYSWFRFAYRVRQKAIYPVFSLPDYCVHMTHLKRGGSPGTWFTPTPTDCLSHVVYGYWLMWQFTLSISLFICFVMVWWLLFDQSVSVLSLEIIDICTKHKREKKFQQISSGDNIFANK